MAEEKEKTDYGAIAKKWVKIIVGILIILAGGFLAWTFLPELWYVFKALIGVVLIVVGLIVVAIGWTD